MQALMIKLQFKLSITKLLQRRSRSMASAKQGSKLQNDISPAQRPQTPQMSETEPMFDSPLHSEDSFQGKSSGDLAAEADLKQTRSAVRLRKEAVKEAIGNFGDFENEYPWRQQLTMMFAHTQDGPNPT